MSFSNWITSRWWVFAVIGSIMLAGWGHALRIGHIDHVSDLAGGDRIATDPSSPTGYVSEKRRLIVPERNFESFQWIMQVEAMFSERSLILKNAEYDNAPEGRAVRSASVYRWWIAGVAWIDHKISGRPIGISIERAALVADPLLHLLLVGLSGVFIKRYFGGRSAALFSLGLVMIFPLGTAFSAGQPGQSAALLASSVASILLLAAGVKRWDEGEAINSVRASKRLLFGSGVASGVGLWIGVSGGILLVMGILLAGALHAFYSSRRAKQGSIDESICLPWRSWAFGGASVVLVAWLIERWPELLSISAWRPDFVHPLYAFAWIACGELLILCEAKKGQFRKKLFIIIASAVLLLALGTSMFVGGNSSNWVIDPIDERLTRLAINPLASGFGSWFEVSGVTALMLGTLIPAVLCAVGFLFLAKAKFSRGDAILFALLLGPMALAVIAAFMQLGWWVQVDVLALAFAAIALSNDRLTTGWRWCFGGITVAAFVVGVGFVYSGLDRDSRNSATTAQVTSMLERHMASWISDRMNARENEVVLAPPSTSASLAFFGSLGVLGTPFAENPDGFAAAVRLSSATSPDEARSVASGRQIGWIVHPSWDSFLEEYARIGTNQPENSLIALLNRWLPPRWLRPVSFTLPVVEGFGDEWVVLFRVVEVQDNVSALGRLVEYFLDTGRINLAGAVHEALSNQFPNELVSHIAAAEVAVAAGDRSGFQAAVSEAMASIEDGADDFLEWDLRVRLSLILAGARQPALSREILELCLRDADEFLLRELPAGLLHGVLRLSKALELEFPRRDLHDFALSLLPEGQRAGL